MRDETGRIPAYQLYGEQGAFPDLLHVERIADRAAGHGWKIAPHRHIALHQLFLITSGTARLTLDGETLTLSPPILINLPRGHVHGFAFSAGTEGFVLTLPAEDFPELFGQAAEAAIPAARPFVLPADAADAARFAALAEAHAGQAPLRRTALRAGAGLLLAHALARAPDDAARGPGPADPRLARFAESIARHLRENWGVEDHASALGLSPRTLARISLAGTGLTPKALIEAHRLREACRLLVYTRMPVSAVAFALGYEDPSYFSRSFLRQTGQSPKAYRARFDRAG